MSSSIARRNKKKSRRRNVPQRTCVGCRTVQSKRDMMRVVRTPKGSVEIDATGKRAGRGAYLCLQQRCWEQALTRNSLEHALKATLDESTKLTLLEYTKHLPVQSDLADRLGTDS